MARRFTPYVSSSCDFLYNPFKRLSTSRSFLTSMTILIPSFDDSSLTSAISSKVLFFIRSAMEATSFSLFPEIVYGISVTTMFVLPYSPFSISVFARTLIFPSPFLYISGSSDELMIIPPVGKSGPGHISNSLSIDIPGLSMTAITASITSPTL